MRVSKPKFPKTFKHLSNLKRIDPKAILERHGRMGVNALSSATPIDSGETANKWSYKLTGNKNRYKLTWYNSEIAGSVPVVILIQYGHATKSGGFVQGIDFINPALKPVFDSLRAELRREVK